MFKLFTKLLILGQYVKSQFTTVGRALATGYIKLFSNANKPTLFMMTCHRYVWQQQTTPNATNILCTQNVAPNYKHSSCTQLKNPPPPFLPSQVLVSTSFRRSYAKGVRDRESKGSLLRIDNFWNKMFY